MHLMSRSFRFPSDARPALRAALAVTTIALFATTPSCVGEKAAAPTLRDASATIGAVTAAPRNAILAVGGTLQLAVSARTLSGTSMTVFDSVEYALQNVTDSQYVHLSSEGQLTAVSATPAGSPVVVTVLPFQDGLAKVDKVIVQVTTSVVPGVTLSIQPTGTDSTRLASGSSKQITPLLRNPTTGARIIGPTLRYTVSDTDAQRVLVYQSTGITNGTVDITQTDQASLDACCGGLNGISAKVYDGSAWIHADVNVYGTLLRDSVQYTFTPPFAATISFQQSNLKVNNTGDHTTIYLARTGTLTVTNFLNTTIGTPVSITFDDSSGIGPATPPSTFGGASGNIVDLPAGSRATRRRFSTAGTYHWTGVVGGSSPPYSGQTSSGTIVVR